MGSSTEVDAAIKKENKFLALFNKRFDLQIKKHFLYLAGMRIDFHEGADAQGFVFEKAEA